MTDEYDYMDMQDRKYPDYPGHKRTMTHDPLCQMPARCQCDLIARVREDERGKWSPMIRDSFIDGYAAALRDAVEAVKSLAHEVGPCFHNTSVGCTCVRGEAVAAIEALGGER